MFLRYNTRRGHRYYTIVESRRSGDKMTQPSVLYLGRIDHLDLSQILDVEEKIKALGEPKLLESFQRELFILGYSVADFFQYETVFQYGDMAAFWNIANLLDIPGIITRAIPKGGGPNIGNVVTIMSICQSLSPTSKRDLRNWYEETSLPYVTGILPQDVEEWNLYSAMAYLTKERIERIEQELTEVLVNQFQIGLDTCLYDLTSTFFYGKKDGFKRHGYSRDHMSHLAQVVIGLALTKEDGFPVKHWVHPGNTPDVTVLPEAARSIKQLYRNHEITLVFDRGNLSEKNVGILDGLGYNFICGLKRNVVAVKDIIRRAKENGPFEIIKCLSEVPGEEEFVYGSTQIAELWGKERKIVICFSEPLAEAEKENRKQAIEQTIAEFTKLQVKTKETNCSHDSVVIELHEMLKNVSKYFHTEIVDQPPTTELSIKKTEGGQALDQRNLRWIDQKLDVLKSKADTMNPDEVRNEVTAILGNKKKYYRYRVKQSPKHSEITWNLKSNIIEQANELAGFYAIMSTNTELSIEDIIEINDKRDVVEKSFQTLKNPIKIRPIRHWVPQKVRAHIYICLLGYILRQMLQFLMKQKGLNYSIHEALIALRRVKLIQIGRENEVTKHFKLTKLNTTQRELFDLVGLDHEPP